MTIIPIEGAKGTTYQARWPDPANPKKMKTKNFKSKADAKTYLRDLPQIQEEERAQAEIDASLTIGRGIDIWLNAVETTGVDGKPPVEPSTSRHYRTEIGHVRPLVIEIGGEPRVVDTIKLKELTTPLMAAIRDAALSNMGRSKAQRAFSRLRFALNEMRRRGNMDANPAQGLTIRMGDRNKDIIEIPDEHEMEAVIQQAKLWAVSDHKTQRAAWQRYNLIIRLFVTTGMRPSELRGLPIEAVDRDSPLIQIFQRADERGIIGPPKSRAGYRDLRIDRELWEELKAWIAGLPANAKLVFPTVSGKPQSLWGITGYMWWPLLRKTGLVDEDGEPKYRLYDCRHFYASTEISLGANEKDLQTSMGHASIKITLDTYGHLLKRRSSGAQAARAEERARRLAGNRPEEKVAQVVQFKRVG